MLCRLFFQIYIKIKTEITEIDIAESKIQLISLQLNPREKEGTYRTQEREREGTNWTQEREKEPTELKREGEGTYWTQEREKEPTELKRERRNLLNSREGEPSEAPQAMYYSR